MSKQQPPSKPAQDNRANQVNPQHPAYHQSRGASPGEAENQAEQAREPVKQSPAKPESK